MAHSKLLHSRTAIDRAGRYLLAPSDEAAKLETALEALNSWRSFHSFPLNTIAVDLKQKVNRLGRNLTPPVRRLKRTRSILSKLSRESMRLTQMQDIGGCRAVLPDIESIYALKRQYEVGRSQHDLVHVDDYIKKPKESGYRGLHLIFRFASRGHPEYNNLLIEVQLRSPTQHAWATAVETVGAVTGQALKSSEGEGEWLDYFKCASQALEHVEHASLSPSRSPGLIARTLIALGKKLEVARKLTAYREALKATEKTHARKAAYFLLVLLPEQPQLQIFSYTRYNADQAFRDYEKLERQLPLYPSKNQLALFPDLENYSGAQAVLVGAESFKSIRESYPNYYLDTEEFLGHVEAFVAKYRRAP